MDRRDFIVKGGAVSAALLASTSVLGSITKISKPKRIGVIGTGGRGCGLISVTNEIEGLKVVACCDTLPFRLEEGLAKCDKKAKGYVNYKDLLADPKIDAVIITAPFGLHYQMAVDAIDAGKHVYCEKTTVKGYDAVKNLVKKVKNSNVIFQTGHQYHSSRMYTHLVDLIKNGKVGKIAAFECQWNRFSNWRKPVPDPKLERDINWRLYKKHSGGLPAELCSHQIDFVNWVLSATPDKVMGIGGIDYWKDGRETFDNVHLMYSYPEGVKAKFTCINSNKRDGYQIKVIGDKGTLIINQKRAIFYPSEVKKSLIKKEIDGYSGATVQGAMGYGEQIKVEHLEPTKQALIDFRESLLTNKQPASDVITGCKTAICVQMGLDAMYNEEIVHWKPEFDII
ncbi:Gfo/Idh/MocA family oxidoreductase [uncultured Lutibacter sp.]|uniref:Gfo/Idh/MocA family protein n=1 Tax=uncultured Lutibacter sp. TaxID=437739 RepID=UPI00262057DF|nr:Gfo/Idh/MocA family oxidoreductase [uncultured Lutibacter sp.]